MGVAKLEGRSRLDDEDAAARQLVPLGRLAEVDRQRPVEDDEDLLLDRVAVPLAARPVDSARGWRGSASSGRRGGHLAPAVVAARLPGELAGVEDRVLGHEAEYR